MIPERSEFQLSGSSTFQSAAGVSFPKMPGVQLNDLAAARAAEGVYPSFNKKIHMWPDIYHKGQPFSLLRFGF